MRDNKIIHGLTLMSIRASGVCQCSKGCMWGEKKVNKTRLVRMGFVEHVSAVKGV